MTAAALSSAGSTMVQLYHAFQPAIQFTLSVSVKSKLEETWNKYP